MKKLTSILLAGVLTLGAVLSFSACGKTDKTITIAVPNDTTNEARALLLLENLGIIEIDGTKGQTATIKDITSNPKNIQLPSIFTKCIAPNRKI